MCAITIHRSPTCAHTWLALAQPCGAARNLLNCAHFRPGATSRGTRWIWGVAWAAPRSCPRCDWGGAYDMRLVRMLRGRPVAGSRWRLGG